MLSFKVTYFAQPNPALDMSIFRCRPCCPEIWWPLCLLRNWCTVGKWQLMTACSLSSAEFGQPRFPSFTTFLTPCLLLPRTRRHPKLLRSRIWTTKSALLTGGFKHSLVDHPIIFVATSHYYIPVAKPLCHSKGSSYVLRLSAPVMILTTAYIAKNIQERQADVSWAGVNFSDNLCTTPEQTRRPCTSYFPFTQSRSAQMLSHSIRCSPWTVE